MNDCIIDSPFHRMVESDLDRKIKAVKTKFVDILKPILLSNREILSAELTHLELSVLIFINFHVTTQTGSQSLIKMQYDMDKRKFNVPLSQSLSPEFFGVSSQAWWYFFAQNPKLRDVLRYAVKSTLEVSKLPGLGTRKGDDWITDESPDQMADEFLESLCGKK